MNRKLSRRAAIAFAAAAFAGLAVPAAAATKIERIVSPGGIEAWLVQDSTVPLVSLQFAFFGGAALSIGLTVDQVRTWPDRMRAVTVEAVSAAAKKWFDKRQSVTGYLLPAPAAADGKRS